MMTMATGPGDPNALYEAITNLIYIAEQDPYQDDALIHQEHAAELLTVLPATLVEGARKWSRPQSAQRPDRGCRERRDAEYPPTFWGF